LCGNHDRADRRIGHERENGCHIFQRLGVSHGIYFVPTVDTTLVAGRNRAGFMLTT
jgi:hypothetical protein